MFGVWCSTVAVAIVLLLRRKYSSDNQIRRSDQSVLSQQSPSDLIVRSQTSNCNQSINVEVVSSNIDKVNSVAATWQKHLALCIDIMFMLVVGVLIWVPGRLLVAFLSSENKSVSDSLIYFSDHSIFEIAILVVLVSCNILFVRTKGQTLGKMIMKVKLVDTNTKSVCGWQQCLMRHYLPTFLLILVLLFDLLFLFVLLIVGYYVSVLIQFLLNLVPDEKQKQLYVNNGNKNIYWLDKITNTTIIKI